MYIILDTNIIIKDYYFSSAKFKSLFSYLDKVQHRLILPQIVVDELKINHIEDINKLKSSLEKLDKESPMLLGLSSNFNQIDLDKENKKYEDFLNVFIKNHKIIILDYDQQHYKEIIARSLVRKAPFKKGAKDHGFKDAVLWEAVKNTVSDEKYKFIAFISNNISEFADSSKEYLNADLHEEICKYKNDFLYFPNLESFLEKYGDRLKGISQDTLQVSLNKEIDKMLFKEEELMNVFQYGFILPVRDIGLQDAVIKNFYISKADKNHYYVEAVGIATAQVVYYHPDDEVIDDVVTTRFNTSFKISKLKKQIVVEEFALEIVEEQDPF